MTEPGNQEDFEAGVVSALFVKPLRHQSMEAVSGAEARARRGLLGDCHAHPRGPRQVLIVREESLAGLGVSAWQVRANIATRGLADEHLRSGAVLRIGADVRVRVTHQCEVCKVLRRYVSGESFRSLPGRRGSLGVFLQGGPVAIGDGIHVEAERYPEVPESIFDRLAWVVARVPPGRVLTYDVLLALIGGSKPYFRVLPTYLKRADTAGLPAHRVLNSAAELNRHLLDQASRLAAEGVTFDDDALLTARNRLWDGRDLYFERS